MTVDELTEADVVEYESVESFLQDCLDDTPLALSARLGEREHPRLPTLGTTAVAVLGVSAVLAVPLAATVDAATTLILLLPYAVVGSFTASLVAALIALWRR